MQFYYSMIIFDAVCVSTKLRLHATLVSAVKVMCSLVTIIIVVNHANDNKMERGHVCLCVLDMCRPVYHILMIFRAAGHSYYIRASSGGSH